MAAIGRVTVPVSARAATTYWRKPWWLSRATSGTDHGADGRRGQQQNRDQDLGRGIIAGHRRPEHTTEQHDISPGPYNIKDGLEDKGSKKPNNGHHLAPG